MLYICFTQAGSERQKTPVENKLGFLRKAIEEEWQMDGQPAQRRNAISESQLTASEEERLRLKPKTLRVGRKTIPYSIANVYIKAIRNGEHIELVKNGLRDYNVSIERFTKLCEKYGL